MGPEVFPLLLLFCHKAHESRIRPQLIEVRIMLEKRIAREAIVCSHPKVVEGLFMFVQQRIG
jgi:hypothetical protein